MKEFSVKFYQILTIVSHVFFILSFIISRSYFESIEEQPFFISLLFILALCVGLIS